VHQAEPCHYSVAVLLQQLQHTRTRAPEHVCNGSSRGVWTSG
jgi:hypothetical protein